MAGKDTGMVGCQPTVIGNFFKAVVQAVLLFGLETWVMTPRMVRSLGGGSAQSRQEDYGETDNVTGGWELIVPTSGYSNVGGGV